MPYKLKVTFRLRYEYGVASLPVDNKIEVLFSKPHLLDTEIKRYIECIEQPIVDSGICNNIYTTWEVEIVS